MKTNAKKMYIFSKGIIYCVLVFLIKKANIIFIPSENEMVEFQFGLITISTVFAGFSFTVLGMLLGMFSEPMMRKLKDTSIVTQRSKKIITSILFFCGSGIVSLLFILKIDLHMKLLFPKTQGVIEFFYIVCVMFLITGIIYFVISTWGVFKLIVKVYSYNVTKYKVMEEEYMEEIEKAKKYQSEIL